jgi:hypothetical protein
MLTLSQIPSVSVVPPAGATGLSADESGQTSAFRKVAEFLLLVFTAIGVNYYAPDFMKFAFFATTLVAYFRSKDEGFWLAFFLVLSDGFFGFFGLYGALISLIPGLPPIEVGQVYIALTLVKAAGRPLPYRVFYSNILGILLIYLVFLLAQGYAIGVSLDMNIQFRLVKWLLPLFMLYSLPRLFQQAEQYRDLFMYLFIVALFALGAQVFTIMTSKAPPQYFGVPGKAWFAIKVKAGKTYRGLYNEYILLITFFAAFYFLCFRPGKYFKSWYLFAIILANCASVFLSATRGWVLSFSFVLFFSFLFVLRFSAGRLFSLLLLAGLFLFGAQSLPIIGVQIENAVKRLLTLEKLAEGDLSAGGTLIRLNTRGPRVMKKWAQSPITGWGFSNDFIKAQDVHVGNQNVLMHSGVIGYALMHFFFLFFMAKLFLRSIGLPRGSPTKHALLFFCIFFPGWFMLHSSSQQFFSYYQSCAGGMMQAIFFCMAALTYEISNQELE